MSTKPMSSTPRFPIYIPSKGRHETRLTVRALDRMGVPYRVIVEAQQFQDYASVINRDRLIVLDQAYQRDYDPLDEFGLEKSKGSGPARNFAWDHSVSEGHQFHWIVDDNIRTFHRLNRNHKIPFGDGAVFRCIEEFVLRYRNVALSGPNYRVFMPQNEKRPPIILNNRVFSCILIRNEIPFRWRGRYNEDLDLSLRVLKAGWCTVQFNAFLQDKMRTQTIRGGNTDEIYKDGTLSKSRMIVDNHPDVAKLTWRFGRWHHIIDYRPFARNKLIRRDDVEIPSGQNEYGMRLVQL